MDNNKDNVISGDGSKSFKDALSKLTQKENSSFETIPLKDIPQFYARNIVSSDLIEHIEGNEFVRKTFHVEKNALLKIIREDMFNRVIPMVQGTIKIHKMPLVVNEENSIYIPMRLLGLAEEDYIDSRLRLEKKRKAEIPENDLYWINRRLIMQLSLSTSSSPFSSDDFIKSNKLNTREDLNNRYLSEEEIGLLPYALFRKLADLYLQLELDYNPDKLNEDEIDELIFSLINGGGNPYDPKKYQLLNGYSSVTKSFIILRLLEIGTLQKDKSPSTK